MKKPSRKTHHVTKGNVFDDLGFSREEAAALKIKAGILSALLERIRRQRYSQSQLAKILGEHQPNISNLLNGKISSVSIEKLLSYAQRLDLDAHITMKPSARVSKSRKARAA
jgi:predicted XRE-type DNA-binding protein